jgi:hypothetical protein
MKTRGRPKKTYDTPEAKEEYIRKLMAKRKPKAKRGRPAKKKTIDEQEIEAKFAPTAPQDRDIEEEFELMTNKYKG